MTRQVWWTEVRRHVGFVVLAVWVVAGIAFLFTHQEWAGELVSLAVEQRIDVIVLGPIAVSLSVWAGGRERRRGLAELVATTPAPSWSRHLVRWSALTATLCAGLLVTTIVGASFVLGHSTYLGGRWWLILAITWSGLGALVALGLAIGALAPWRVTAPLAGLATYVGLGVPGYLPDVGPQFLLPNGYESLFVGLQPGLWPGVVSLVFFGMLTVALIAVMSRGARRVAVPFAAAAIVVGVAAGSQPEHWWWRADPEGAASVCSTDQPRVCVMRVHAEMLPAVTHAVRPVLSGMGDAAPPRGAREAPITQSPPSGGEFVPLSLYGQISLTGSSLLRPIDLQAEAASSPAIRCTAPNGASNDYYRVNTALELGWTAIVLKDVPESAAVESTMNGPGYDTDITRVRSNLLAATSPEQQSLLRTYAAAGRTCDRPAVEALYHQWAE